MAKKILVVDDEEEILNLVHKKLLAEGYEVFTAMTAGDAIRRARKEKPDLVLMDILLPDMEGPQAVQELYEDPGTREISVVFLSGIVTGDQGDHRQTEVTVAGRVYPALPKPFSPTTLLSVIRKELE